MNPRRKFFTQLAALAGSTVLPTLPQVQQALVLHDEHVLIPASVAKALVTWQMDLWAMCFHANIDHDVCNTKQFIAWACANSKRIIGNEDHKEVFCILEDSRRAAKEYLRCRTTS